MLLEAVQELRALALCPNARKTDARDLALLLAHLLDILHRRPRVVAAGLVQVGGVRPGVGCRGVLGNASLRATFGAGKDGEEVLLVGVQTVELVVVLVGRAAD